MTTSEPTTGEITTRLYGWIAKAGNQERCRDELIAINALTRQEREIERLKTAMTVAKNIIANRTDELSGITGELERMTASAEQAETREKAAIKALSEYEDALYPTAEDVMRDLNTL